MKSKTEARVNESYMTTLNGLKCLRCSHKWIQRKANHPKVCPKCKSPWWNVER